MRARRHVAPMAMVWFLVLGFQACGGDDDSAAGPGKSQAGDSGEGGEGAVGGAGGSGARGGSSAKGGSAGRGGGSGAKGGATSSGGSGGSGGMAGKGGAGGSSGAGVNPDCDCLDYGNGNYRCEMSVEAFLDRVPLATCGATEPVFESIERETCDDGTLFFTQFDEDGNRYELVMDESNHVIAASASGKVNSICNFGNSFDEVDVTAGEEPDAECSQTCDPCRDPSVPTNSLDIPICDLCVPGDGFFTLPLEEHCKHANCPETLDQGLSFGTFCSAFEGVETKEVGCGYVALHMNDGSDYEDYYYDAEDGSLFALSVALGSASGPCASGSIHAGELPEPCPSAVMCDVCKGSGYGAAGAGGEGAGGEGSLPACE